jgi:phosphoesterase RecJ-like protein
MKPIQEFFSHIITPKKIVITTHYKPDADAIGSSLGLYHYLKNFNHSITVISPSEVPAFLMWMPEVELVVDYEAQKEIANEILNQADYIFCLDFNHPSRVRTMEKQLIDAPAQKIIIDHHLEPLTDFFAYGISMPDKSSTCEMVYDFIQLNQGDDLLNQDIMQCLYAGCMTDTGSFRFPATTASVHEMIANFKRKGLEHSKIHQEIYDNFNANRLRLLGHILNTIYLNEVEHFAIMYLSLADAKRFDVKSGDTEGIVNYGLSVNTISVVFFLTERATGEVRISMRSKGNVDVSAFSRAYFNGGGHFNAAGGISHESLDATINKIKDLVVATSLIQKN